MKELICHNPFCLALCYHQRIQNCNEEYTVELQENMYFYSSHHPQMFDITESLCRANKTDESIISLDYFTFLLLKSDCVLVYLHEQQRE